MTIWGEIASFAAVVAPKHVQEAYLSLSAAVNCTVTFLTGWKLMQKHRQNAKLNIQSDSKMYPGVVGMVAESALLFAMASTFLAICYEQSASHPSSWKAWNISDNVARIIVHVTQVSKPNETDLQSQITAGTFTPTHHLACNPRPLLRSQNRRAANLRFELQ